MQQAFGVFIGKMKYNAGNADIMCFLDGIFRTIYIFIESGFPRGRKRTFNIFFRALNKLKYLHILQCQYCLECHVKLTIYNFIIQLLSCAYTFSLKSYNETNIFNKYFIRRSSKIYFFSTVAIFAFSQTARKV